MKKIMMMIVMGMFLIGCSYNETTLWPDGIVRYKIHSSMEEYHIDHLMLAMRTWEDATDGAIVFIESNDDDAVVIQLDDNQSYATIGRNTESPNYIKLTDGDTNFQATIQHELGHTLGLEHEHKRPDRDQYVVVYMALIPKAQRDDYKKKKPYFYHYLDYPYDYGSIMHYPDHAYLETPDNLGYKSISPIDVQKIEDMYSLAFYRHDMEGDDE